VTASLIVVGATLTAQGVLLLVGAKIDVISLHVRRPPKPRNRPEVPGA